MHKTQNIASSNGRAGLRLSQSTDNSSAYKLVKEWDAFIEVSSARI